MEFGKRIKELRNELNITCKELAERLDIPARTIGSYERDEALPGPKFFKALMEIYHVNINWILSGSGDMFLSEHDKKDLDFLTQQKEKSTLTDEELAGLINLLDSEASRDMVMKFIAIKKGNKEALDSLINNLQGIKAIL